MGPLVVILIGALAVFWFLGLLTPQRMRVIGGIGGLLIGLLLSARGAPLAGIPLMAAGGWLFWTATQKPELSNEMTIAKAAALLGVGETATPDQIRKAHRLAIAAAHPDRGGSEAKSADLNAARDVLLAARSPKKT